MDRRTLLLGAAAAGLVAPGRAWAEPVQTEYKLVRDGADIGRHTITAKVEDGVLVVAIAIDIAVKVLGITAYRYKLTNTERWRAGRIVSVDSVVNDDGSKEYCKVKVAGAALEVDGTDYSGSAPGDAVTTSYFARAFIDRPTWISTQSGQVMTMTAKGLGGSPEGWSMQGQMKSGPFATTLYYDAEGDWVSSFFDAKGTRINYARTKGGGLNALWAAS